LIIMKAAIANRITQIDISDIFLNTAKL